MAQVYNNTTKTWEDVADHELPSAIHSGSHSFEADIDIPMIDTDGNPILVPSENAGKAFGYGFQLSTPAAASAAYDKASDKAMQARMGEIPGTTFGLNALGAATFGATDVGARVLGGSDYAKARNAADEANPIAAGLGTATGVVASMGAGPVGIGGRAATRIGESVAGAAAEGLGSGAVARATSKALGSAAEGAYFGLGTGLSEAALGDPNDVASNIISGIGLGGAIGGVGSLAFGAASAGKSAFQKLVSSSVDKASEVVGAAAAASGKQALKTALASRGETSAAQGVDDLFKRGSLDALDSEAVQAGQKELKGASKAEQELNKQLGQQSKATKESIEFLTKDAQESSKAAIVAADGDAEKAIAGMRDSYVDANDNFRTYREQQLADKPAVAAPEARKALKETIKDLSSIAVTDQEKRFVRELYETADAHFGMPSERLDGAFLDRAPAMADELEAAKSVREYIGQKQNFAKGSPLMRASSNEFREAIKESFLPKFNALFEEHYPDQFAGQYMSDMRKWYDGINALEGTVRREGVSAVGSLIETKAGQVLGKISDFAPELEAARLAAGNAEKLSQINKDAFVKLKRLQAERGEFGQKLSYDDFKDILKDLTPTKSITDRLDRLKSTQELINNTQNLSPIDKAIQIKKALGHDVSNLEALQPHMKALDAMSKLQALKQDPNWLANQVPGVRNIVGAYNNPARIVRGVQGIQKLADQGARALDKTVKFATDALLGKTAEKAVIKGETIKKVGESADSRRSRFDAARAKIAELQNPDTFTSHIAGSMGGIEGTPNIKAAITARLMSGVQYLAQQIPQDPMAGTSILANKTNFTPSDAAVSKFMRQVDAVSSPTKVIDRLASGRVSMEEIQALKTVHPEIYQKLQASVINGIMEHGDKIPYEKRLQIGQLFNTPTDYSMQPQFIASMQQNFANTDGGRPDGAQDTQQRDYSGRKPNLNTKKTLATYQTSSDTLTYKGQG